MVHSTLVGHRSPYGSRSLAQRQIARAILSAEKSLLSVSRTVVVEGPGSDRKRISKRKARLPPVSNYFFQPFALSGTPNSAAAFLFSSRTFRYVLSMKPSRPWTLDRIFRLCLAIIVIAGGFWLTSTLSTVLIPFGVAFLIAYILNPIVEKLAERMHSRTAAVTVTLGTSAILFAACVFFMIAPIKAQMVHATDLIGRAISDTDFSQAIGSHLPPVIWNAIRIKLGEADVFALLQNQEFLKAFGSILYKIAPGAFSLLTGTLDVILWLLGCTMVFIYLVFMMLDFQRLRADLTGLIPPRYQHEVFEFVKQFDSAMSSYFRARAIMSLILAVVFAIGFSMISLPLAIVFGILVGLVGIVPYLQYASIPVAALLALLQSVDHSVPFWQTFALVLAVYFFAEILQDFILIPRIVGNASGLSPVMILLSLSVWGKLLGFFGLIVAIPFTCLVLAYYERLLASKPVETSE